MVAKSAAAQHSTRTYQASKYQPVWVRENFIDFALSTLNPLWTWRAVKAKVQRINTLPDNMVEVTLTANRHFKPYTAGQFVFVTVQINGVNEQRAYSIVNAPSRDHATITLAAKVQGKVSRYLAQDLKVGDVITISQPQGDFQVKTDDVPLLFIAAGSGITPIISMIRDQLNKTRTTKSSTTPMTLLYFSRDPVYRAELTALAEKAPQFTLHIIQDSAEAPAQFNQQLLDKLNIAPENMHTYLCGAPALMQAVNALWQEKSLSAQLMQERFVVPATSDNATSYPVNFRQKQRTFDATGSLLVSAEKAGLNPASGCRMGICNTCVCQKVSGTVRNQLTGETSNRPNEAIKLCISEALTPLEIDA